MIVYLDQRNINSEEEECQQAANRVDIMDGQ